MPLSAKDVWKSLFFFVEGVRNYQTRTVHFKRTAGERELTFPQVRVLGTVFMSSTGSVRVKDISDELGITPGAVSQSVDHLVSRGLLVRCQAEDDRRAVSIRLSERGLELNSHLDTSFNALFQRLLADIEPGKLEVFYEVLTSFHESLEREKSLLALDDVKK